MWAALKAHPYLLAAAALLVIAFACVALLFAGGGTNFDPVMR
ncbi:MAG: hypothetical protein ABW275_02325 [Hansschlegelia sp.]